MYRKMLTKEIKKMECRIAEVSLLENRLIYIKHKQVKEFPSFEEIKEMMEKCLKLADNKEFILITDFRDMFQNWSAESKEYVTNHVELNRLKTAQAILVNTLPVKLLLNIYIKFNKPKGEFRIFENEEKLENWINEIRS